jgi:serine/threonine-protein kinase
MTALPQRVGDYELAEHIGSGGMGTVYACHRKGDRQRYAIKMLTHRVLAKESEHERFLRECQVLARLSHPHILQVRDYGVVESVPYLVTELCADARGKPLSMAGLQARTLGRRVDPYALLALVPQVCWALAYIHQNGLIHRDIKPENILVKEDRLGTLSARLGDFGLARPTTDSEIAARRSWSDEDYSRASGGFAADAGGTYDYMSPEQLAGHCLDARTDVYSLGVTLYRVATGYDRVFFVKPSVVVPVLPPWIDELVAKSVSPDKEQRCRDALEMLYCLPPSLRPGEITRD